MESDQEKNLSAPQSTPASKPSSSMMGTWFMWSFAAMFYLYQFILRVSPTAMMDELSADFMLDACAVGAVVSFYYWAYAGLQIPVGIVMDRFGPKKLIVLASLICALGCGIFAYAENPYVASFGRLLMGVGSACGFLGCVKLGSIWFPADKLTLVVGMTMFVGAAGPVMAGKALGPIVKAMGWRDVMVGLGIMGLVICALVFIFVRDKNPNQVVTKEDQVSSGVFDALKKVALNPYSWLFGLYGGLMYTPLSAFADAWGPKFVDSGWGMGIEKAAFIVSTFYIGVSLGGPIFAAISTKLASHKKMLIIAPLMSIALCALMIYFPGMIPEFTLYGLLPLVGLATSGQFLCFAAVSSLNPKSATATANGFHNMLCMMSGVILQPLVGKLMDYSSGEVGAQVVHKLADYQFGLTSVIVCMGLAFFLTFLMPETYKKESE